MALTFTHAAADSQPPSGGFPRSGSGPPFTAGSGERFTYDSVARLPLQGFVAEPLVCVMRRRPFELADEITDQDGGLDADTQMDVSFDASDFVDVHAWRFNTAPAQIGVDDGFHLWWEQRTAALGVPDDVEVDFRVVIARHLRFPYARCAEAKAEPREAP